jgi:hypothetical protein
MRMQKKNSADFHSLRVNYAIVSRIFDTMTGQPVVIAAGVHPNGNRSRGGMLLGPSLFCASEETVAGRLGTCKRSVYFANAGD